MINAITSKPREIWSEILSMCGSKKTDPECVWNLAERAVSKINDRPRNPAWEPPRKATRQTWRRLKLRSWKDFMRNLTFV